MRLTSLKTLIKADTKKMLTEDWGGSDEGVLLNSMHKDLRNPKDPPSIIAVFDASETANDFYREEESDYDRFRDSHIKASAHKYYQKYFPVFYKGMKELFS